MSDLTQPHLRVSITNVRTPIGAFLCHSIFQVQRQFTTSDKLEVGGLIAKPDGGGLATVSGPETANLTSNRISILVRTAGVETDHVSQALCA